MGAAESKQDSDAATEDKGQSGTLRGFLKNRSPGSATSFSKRSSAQKNDESDNTRRLSQQSTSNSSNASDKDPSSEHPEALSPENGSKQPDGISKMAKVVDFIIICLHVCQTTQFFFQELIIRSQQQETKDGISPNIFSVSNNILF